MSHYNRSSGSGSYYSRSRDSDRGRDRDKEWGRDWRRNDRDRSRDRDRRSPSRDTRYSDYNRDRRQNYYAPDDHGSRYSKFSNSGPGKYGGKYSHRGHSSQSSAYSSTSTLIREKDLPNRSHQGYAQNHYGTFQYNKPGHYSNFSNAQGSPEKVAVQEVKDPKDDPQFKAALDTCISNMKTRGDYDQIRKECLSDIDTKAAFINLHGRIKSTVDKFLGNQVFTKDFDKVKTREQMRKKISDTPYFENGIESVVNQILMPKLATLIRPKIEDEVYKYLNIDKDCETTVESPAHNQPGNKPDAVETPGSVDTKSLQEKPVNPLLSKVISFSVGAGNAPSRTAAGLTHANFTNDEERTEGFQETDTRTSSAFSNSKRTPVSDQSDSMSGNFDSFDDSGSQRHGGNEIEFMGQKSPQYNDVQPRTPPGAPPPPSIPFGHIPHHVVVSSNSLLPCTLPDMSVPPPFMPQNTNTYVPHPSHFPPLGVHGMMDQRLAMPPLPPSTSIPPPPLPPLPPASNSHPPLPPSPTDQNPHADASDGSRPRPPSPPPERGQYSYSDDDEPLPPGEEPESYFQQLKQSRSLPPRAVQTQVKAISPISKAAESLNSDKEEENMEVDDMELEDEEMEEDSEEESPMFEKIGEVSPPRTVVLQNSELVKELSKDLLGVGAGLSDTDEANRDPKSDVNFDNKFAVESECKYLESTPMYDYKVSYYKRVPDS